MESQRTVQQSEAVNTLFEDAWTKIMGGDLGLRGYMITKQKGFLLPYESANSTYLGVLESLESSILTAGISVEHTYPQYKQSYLAKMAEAQEIVSLVNEGQDSVALQLLLRIVASLCIFTTRRSRKTFTTNLM